MRWSLDNFKELEEALPEKAEEVKESQPSMEDMAAMDYQTLLPQFADAIEYLTKTAQKRVIMAILEHPLHNLYPSFNDERERKAFHIGAQISDCKFIIMRAAMELAQDQTAMKELNAEVERLKTGDKINVG